MFDRQVIPEWRDGKWCWTQPYVQYHYRSEPAAAEVWNLDSEVTDLSQARAALARIMSL